MLLSMECAIFLVIKFSFCHSPETILFLLKKMPEVILIRIKKEVVLILKK